MNRQPHETANHNSLHTRSRAGASRGPRFWIGMGVGVGALGLGILALQLSLAFGFANRIELSAALTDVEGSAVELDGSTVVSECFTFSLPQQYTLSEESAGCLVEILIGDGASGDVGSYRIVAQVGSETFDDHLELMKGKLSDRLTVTGTAEIEIDGRPGNAIYYEAYNGQVLAIWYSPEESPRFRFGSDEITSFAIFGPSFEGTEYESIAEDLVASFHRTEP